MALIGPVQELTLQGLLSLNTMNTNCIQTMLKETVLLEDEWKPLSLNEQFETLVYCIDSQQQNTTSDVTSDVTDVISDVTE